MRHLTNGGATVTNYTVRPPFFVDVLVETPTEDVAMEIRHSQASAVSPAPEVRIERLILLERPTSHTVGFLSEPLGP